MPGSEAGGMDVELLAAALRQDAADLDLYAKVLSVNLVESLPQGAVQVERKRSMSDRVAGREGTVVALDVSLGDTRLGLRMDRGRAVGEICKEVRGVVLSRQEVNLDEFLGDDRVDVVITNRPRYAAGRRAELNRPGLRSPG